MTVSVTDGPAIVIGYEYRLQIEAFARAATGEDAAVFSLESSVLNQKLIDAIYRAGETGNWEAVS